jgi:hypothetical protein
MAPPQSHITLNPLCCYHHAFMPFPMPSQSCTALPRPQSPLFPQGTLVHSRPYSMPFFSPWAPPAHGWSHPCVIRIPIASSDPGHSQHHLSQLSCYCDPSPPNKQPQQEDKCRGRGGKSVSILSWACSSFLPIEHSLCVRADPILGTLHVLSHLTSIKPRRQIPIYEWRNWGPGVWSKFPIFTSLVGDRARIQNKAIWLQSLCSHHLKLRIAPHPPLPIFQPSSFPPSQNRCRSHSHYHPVLNMLFPFKFLIGVY